MFAFFYVVYALVVVGRSNANAIGGAVSRTFMMCGVLTIFLWFLYPVAWGLSEGGNVIHPDSEAIFYGILDVFAKPVFGFLLIFGHNNIAPEELGLNIREIGGTGSEKTRNGHNNGVADTAV
jgi:bacteriorhodopsin